MLLRVLCGILAVAALGTGNCSGKSDIVRLHVIAESDSREDQALKMQVRDAVLDIIAPQTEKCRDWDEVFTALEECREAVLMAAAETAGEDVRVETGVFAFDQRSYMGNDIPAGNYRAMRVVIGSGRGRNWWGIMFPGAMPCETGEDTVYYSAVVEWIFGLFGRKFR